MLNLIKKLFGKKKEMLPGEVVKLAIVEGYYGLSENVLSTKYMCIAIDYLLIDGRITYSENVKTSKAIKRVVYKNGKQTLHSHLNNKGIEPTPENKMQFWNDFIANHS